MTELESVIGGDPYDALGVTCVMNCEGRLTVLGGSLIPEPVLDAMRAAAQRHVDIHELQQQVGARLAALTRNDAAYVATGAAAGIVLCTLAAITGEDRRRISRLPDLSGMRNEVIAHRSHRVPYSVAVNLAGARLVEIGNAIHTPSWELEAAITDRTAAVLYVAGAHLEGAALGLEETIQIAHSYHLPVIVDAAAQLPPVSNLWHFTADLGADVAIFSGGKDLCGPQSSGLIVGSKAMIDGVVANGSPHQHIARAMKVGKEEMVGLVAAVELYLQQDHAGRIASLEKRIERWMAGLDDLPGVVTWREERNQAGQPIPRILIRIDPHVVGRSAAEVRARLRDGSPPIAAGQVSHQTLYLTPEALDDGDDAVVLSRVRSQLKD